MKGQNAIAGAIRRAELRPSNDLPTEAFKPREASAVLTTTDGTIANEKWDNYDDFNDFPDAPP